MKKKTQLTLKTKVTGNCLFPVVLVFVASCTSFLDEAPDNRVNLDNLDKAAQLLTNAYSIASPAFTDMMTDDYDWISGTNIRPPQRQMFAWEDVTTAGPTEQDAPDFFWFQSYSAVAHANEVLTVVDDLPADTEEDKAKKRAVKSEALLTRAYAHFMLVNLFGKHYSSGGAGDGIPYVKTPETTFVQTYKRKSVTRVYSDIEEDLLEGLELLDDSFFANSGKYHFNRNAALAFASRFYLFKGEYQKCLEFSSEMLGSDPGAFVRDLTGPDFKNASSSVVLYPQLYSSPDLAANLLLIRKISLVHRTDIGFGPTSAFYRGLFGSQPFDGVTDERQDPAFVKGENGSFPARYQSLFERSSLNSNVGFPYHIHLAFRGEEVLLNRVEANIYLNRLPEAIADLQVLTEKRFSGAPAVLTMDVLRSIFSPTLSDQDKLLNYLLLERRKEFIGQGMRWFDIKRYNIDVTHTLEDDSTTVTLQEQDLRKVLQIPGSAQEIGGLKPNPR